MPTTAPMLGSRTPNHGFFWAAGNRGIAAPRPWARPEVRKAKLAERIDLDHEVAEFFGTPAAPELFPVYAEIAWADDDIADDEWTPESMLDAAIADGYDPEATPVLGNVFAPDDLQWGFTVRTRF